MKENKVYLVLSAVIMVVVAFVMLEFRRRALTVVCPLMLGVGVLWSLYLLVKADTGATAWWMRLIASGVITIAGIVAMFIGFDVVEISASDVGVLETWESGVQAESLPARTYIATPNERIYIHSLAQKALMIGPTNKEHPEYKVQSSDNQDMFFTLQVVWHRDPTKISVLHSAKKPLESPAETDKAIEDTFIVPVVLKTVNDCATVQEAISVYSGLGRVELHKTIVTALQGDPQLVSRGLVIEDCVIKEIRLDEKYVENIQARQVAQVRESRAKEEEKAAQAEALVAKAEALKLQNQRVTEAETLKQEAELGAKAKASQVVEGAKADAEKVKAAAEADAAKVKLDAEAKLEAALAEAKGIEAIGKAQADADKLKYVALESPGAMVHARIEVSKNLGTAYSGIKGYLPESMNVTTLGTDFQKAIEALVK